jgi:hypothetical protein
MELTCLTLSLMTDTASPTQWLSVAQNLNVGSTSESRGTLMTLMTDSAPPSQWSPLAAQNVNTGHISESRGTPPPVASVSGLPVLTIIQNALRSYKYQSVNEPHSPHTHRFTGPQHQGPNTAYPPSQGPPAGAKNTLGGQYSQVSLNCTIFAPISN